MNNPVAIPSSGRARFDFEELARIHKFCNGRGGYQWGDMAGPDGNYGKETLASLAKHGYAQRTGAYVPNQLGGAWPEVMITPSGILALLQSGDLKQSQNFPTSILKSCWGELPFCISTGVVLGFNPSDMDPEVRIENMPIRIDVAELANSYPEDGIIEPAYDVLDVGYWTMNGRYEHPDADFRKEERGTLFASP